jgi:hypothetical protein
VDGVTRVFKHTDPTGLTVSQPLGTPGQFGEIARRLQWHERSGSVPDAASISRAAASERGSPWLETLVSADRLAGLLLAFWLWLD